MADPGGTGLEERLLSLVSRSRDLMTLDDSKYAPLSNLDDFSSPCQLHPIWFHKALDFHFSVLLRTQLTELPDRVVKIIGPIHPGDAQGTLENLLMEPYWGESLPSPYPESPIPGDTTLRPHIATALRGILDSLDPAILTSARLKTPPQPQVQGRGAFLFGFTWEIIGDPRLVDYSAEIPLRESLVQSAQPQVDLDAGSNNEARAVTGFGARFYPAIWIGEFPDFSPKSALELMRSASPLPGLGSLFMFRKVFDTTYRGKTVVVEKDGHLVIESTSRSEATELLNEIMATAALDGFPSQPVREHELSEAEIAQPEQLAVGLMVTRSSYSQGSLRNVDDFQRNMILNQPFLLRDMAIARRQVSEALIRALIQRAEVVNSAEISKSLLLFTYEAQGHLNHGEYQQAYVMAWLVIERWLHWEWSEFLKSKGISKNRQERLEDKDWTAAVVSESLNLLGVISDEDLNLISQFRRMRNNVVHDGGRPSGSETRQCVEFASKVPVQRVLRTHGWAG